MARSLLSSQRAFPLMLVLTVAVALLPARALGWTKLLAEIMSIPLTPFAHPLNDMVAWLRPAPRAALPGGVTPDAINQLQAEAEEFKRLYLAEAAKVDSLERQLSQLQGFEVGDGNAPVQHVLAHIALRSPTSAYGAVQLNLGSNHGVRSGAVAVYNHVHLLGRITEVAGMQSTMLPLVNLSTKVIGAAVIPHDWHGQEVSIANLPTLPLEPKGNGTFIGGPDHSLIINVGDEVILMDSDWPASAQGMKIGVVESVQPDEKRPLRNIVIVKPTFQVSQIAMVVLRIEDKGLAQ